MRFDIVTLFPSMVMAPLSDSILKRAREAGLIDTRVHNLRDWASGKHLCCDDAPFGGGDGMVMKPDVLARAIRSVRALAPSSKTVFLTPQGAKFDRDMAVELASLPGLILVCGHYAGIDERVRQTEVDIEVSIGDYVLSGGELPALVVIDAVSRLIPGVLGNEASAGEDSFPARLEYPQYTRPREFEGMSAPEILLSGHHENIRKWRRRKSLERTIERRPDLIEKYPLDDEETRLLEERD